METTCIAEKDVTAQLDREIIELQHIAFPGTPEFAHQRWWHTPLQDDLWFTTRNDGGRLVGSIRVVLRDIITAGGKLAVAGIGNVCSHPDARGTGAASASMKAVESFIATSGKVDFGILFCGEKVHQYYARLGWVDASNPAVFNDENGRKTASDGHGFMMIYPGRKTVAEWPAGEIDLNGRDW